MASTAGRTSALVRTERSPMTPSEFQKEIFRLDSTAESKNLMIYGDSNIGKTWVAASCPGRQFWLVGEPGYRSAARILTQQGRKAQGRKITDSASAWGAISFLEERNRYESVDWVILDGFTTMQDKWRFNYAAEAFDIDPTKRQHRNLPDRPDYFNTQNLAKGWIGRLIDLPVNLLVTAHAWRTDKTDIDLFVYPGIQGKVTEVANAVTGLMDAVGYYGWKKVRSRDPNKPPQMVRRLLWSQPRLTKDDDLEIKYLVGDKYDCLGTHMDFPTMPQIIAKIDGTPEEGA